ncbi:MAG: glycosyltransferase [Magnetococcales bacterium]|nr:glycosyltransferase [Magnetococcales bacterium]
MDNNIKNAEPLKIILFIGSLAAGGAERQISQLARDLDKRHHIVTVSTLYPGGVNWHWLKQNSNVKVQSLYPKKNNSTVLTGLQLLSAPLALRKILKQSRPDILYSLLNITNFFAWFATWGFKPTTMVWGIRASKMELVWKEYLPFKGCSWLSKNVAAIIFNSHSGLQHHENCGYRGKKHVVIVNGIDTNRFKPDESLRAKVRLQWGVGDDETLIGLVGRLNSVKEHPTFLKAAAHLKEEYSNLRFICIGSGSAVYTDQLKKMATDLGLDGTLIWTGEFQDMAMAQNGLDIAVSASSSEGFSNTIGEAMACGVPCVVTDVGDSAKIVGDCGVVVAAGDYMALANGLKSLLSKESNKKVALKKAVRSRIKKLYSIDKLVSDTESLLYSLTSD